MVPLAALRVAQIHDRAERKDQARAHYARFLSFWEGSADPALQPEVRRARARLITLGTGSRQ